jgi:hypothetical protein
MVNRFGARCAYNRRTFDTYDRIDDCTYMTVHDLMKYSRLGYSRVTDSLCREVRFGRITRDDALNVQRYYQSEMPKAELDQFCEWLGMKPEGLAWLRQHTHGRFHSIPAPTTLTEQQHVFIHSFQVNTNPVWEIPSYVVFGKGLTI